MKDHTIQHMAEGKAASPDEEISSLCFEIHFIEMETEEGEVGER